MATNRQAPDQDQTVPRSSNHTEDVAGYWRDEEMAMEIDDIENSSGGLGTHTAFQSTHYGSNNAPYFQARPQQGSFNAGMYPAMQNVAEIRRRDVTPSAQSFGVNYGYPNNNYVNPISTQFAAGQLQESARRTGDGIQPYTQSFYLHQPFRQEAPAASAFLPFGPQTYQRAAAPINPSWQGVSGSTTPAVQNGQEWTRSISQGNYIRTGAGTRHARAPLTQTHGQRSASTSAREFQFLQPDETFAEDLHTQPDGADAVSTRATGGNNRPDDIHRRPEPASFDRRDVRETHSEHHPSSVAAGSESTDSNASRAPSPKPKDPFDGENLDSLDTTPRQQLWPNTNTPTTSSALEEATPRAPMCKLPPLVPQQSDTAHWAPGRDFGVMNFFGHPSTLVPAISPFSQEGLEKGFPIDFNATMPPFPENTSRAWGQARESSMPGEDLSASAPQSQPDQTAGAPTRADSGHERGYAQAADVENSPPSSEVKELAGTGRPEDEEGWTPVTAHKRRHPSGSQSGSSERSSQEDQRPEWLRYYPPTRHTPGPRVAPYANSLGNVYIHAMEGERFTPASASKLFTGPVRAKPRPCFLTWWDAGPKNIIYLAPLLGAIPPGPEDWANTTPGGGAANDNLHVLSKPTWRGRWCPAKWLPDARQVVSDGEMVDIIAPPTPEHPNPRPHLRPQITVEWYDSPQEHPLKSSFFWAGDPGEAIDLRLLDSAGEEEKVGPFDQYCHLSMSELRKLHDWWKYMYAADPAAVAPAAE